MSASDSMNAESRKKSLGLSLDRAFDVLGRKPCVLWAATPGEESRRTRANRTTSGNRPESVWTTSPNEHTMRALKFRCVKWVKSVRTRCLKSSVSVAVEVRNSIDLANDFDNCVSTGAAPATDALPSVSLAGLPTIYFESLARPSKPSVKRQRVSGAPIGAPWRRMKITGQNGSVNSVSSAPGCENLAALSASPSQVTL